MNFLRRLFSSPPSNNERFFPITVQCLRCGEILRGQANLTSELSVEEYDGGDNPTGFSVRKVLMGKERCFQQIEVSLIFDSQRRLTDKQITGGKFIEED